MKSPPPPTKFYLLFFREEVPAGSAMLIPLVSTLYDGAAEMRIGIPYDTPLVGVRV